jgi:hypothetical protein
VQRNKKVLSVHRANEKMLPKKTQNIELDIPTDFKSIVIHTLKELTETMDKE